LGGVDIIFFSPGSMSLRGQRPLALSRVETAESLAIKITSA
jgi:hypothetical protein